MLLLHLSDIHFRSPDCLTPDLDPERPYRTLLLQDARTQSAALGPVGAILVSGDIAFKGDPNEYATAVIWLKELAAACNCSIERIFVVPGNHDVDRRLIASTPATRNAQNAIASAQAGHRERELRTQFADAETGRALFAPLTAYNAFAAQFGCQVYPPERMYWKQDLPLQGGVILRVHGLTSTLLSGMGGGDDRPHGLYLSPLQTVLNPDDDVVNLVMCHHPPDWFMDNDDVNDRISARAMLHLFGHKHRQRINQDTSFVRFSAGAVNPERDEVGWAPGYNLVEVNVTGAGAARAIEVKSHLRQWQSSPDLFRAMLTPDRQEVWTHRIGFPQVAAAAAPTTVPDSAPAVEHPTLPEADVEASMGDEGTRNLIFRFWNLTTSQRREIATRHGLVEEGEMQLPEPERYGRALRRAGERGLLEQIADEVSQLESR